MGLFFRLKNIFNKTISVLPNQKNDLVCLAKLKNNMLKIGSEIVVDDNHNAVVVHYNKVCDILGPGEYKADEISVPKLFKYSKAYFTKKGLFTARTIFADIYFVTLQPFKLNYFKTPEKIIATKGKEKVKLKLDGTFTLTVVSAEKVMRTLCNDYAVISGKKAMKEICYTMGYNVSKILNSKKFSLADYLSNKEKIVETLNQNINKFVGDYGLKVGDFFVNTVILPKKYLTEKVVETSLTKQDDTDIVKLVEERLNSLEKSLETVTVEKNTANSIENKIDEEILSSKTTLGPQGEIYVDVGSNSQKRQEENKQANNIKEEYNNASQNTNIIDNIIIGGVGDNSQPEPNIIGNVENKIQNQKKEKINLIFSKAKENKIEQKPQTKICVSCGKAVANKVKVCPHCGKNAENLIVCACCGAKNYESDRLCAVCKSKLH